MLVTSNSTAGGWLDRRGWLVEVLLPRTDTDVAAQLGVLAVISAVLCGPPADGPMSASPWCRGWYWCCCSASGRSTDAGG